MTQAQDGQNRHFMIIDFKGNPGLDDQNSEIRLSLEFWRASLRKVGVYTAMKFQVARHDPAHHQASDSRLCIDFECRAGLDMPGRMSRFVDTLCADAARIRPQNPITQILFSQSFPRL